jgi:hypothetical protein
MNSWYAPLAAIQSLGSLDEGPGSLAGLHEARKRHLSQFFTPEAVVRFMWHLASRAMPATDGDGRPRRYSVLDNSVGSGRMLQFCDPAVHKVGGLDVHAETVDQVKEVFEVAGFVCDFHVGSMETARLKKWSVALVNPPFSIHFENPLLQEFESNNFGRFGPRTAARSDVYALEQALAAAGIVLAVLPRSIADQLERREVCDDWSNQGRLRAIFDLPADTFKDEGADVRVSLAVFGLPCSEGWTGRFAIEDLNAPPAVLFKDWKVKHDDQHAAIRWVGLDCTEPSIKLPVTGDKVVRMTHDGRRIGLKFGCGFTMARVMNAILVQSAVCSPNERLPKQYRYDGSSRLDLEAHIATGDAFASMQALVRDIEGCDAAVHAAPGFWEHLRRRERRSRRQALPLAHVVWDALPDSADTLTGVARKPVVTNPQSWFGWIIKAGDTAVFHCQEDGRYLATSPQGDKYLATLDELQRDFAVSADRPGEGWRDAHPGLLRSYPELGEPLRKRVLALGIDKWLTWGFQMDDLIELLLKPQGCTAAWDMGLGKTRLAVAMILLSGIKHGLVTMDAYLVPEFAGKLQDLPISPDEWQVIDTPEKLGSLKRINLISYERLRSKLPGEKRLTYSHRLRRRIGMLLADEGEILANARSAQSAALWRISAPRRYVLSATPLPNYPRDMLAILAFTGGDGTAAQPWGYNGPYMCEALAKSASFSARGIDAFRDEFVTLEWCTNEFAEDLRSGAKREVPKIANLSAYRQALAPHIKRRITGEPAVQQHVQIPVPSTLVHEVEFDDEHLGYYLTVADEFATWWANEQEQEGGRRRVSSMLKILLKIGAVVRANNVPERPEKGARVMWRGGLTAKQRFTLQRLEELIEQGEKVIMLCHSPATVELFHEELLKSRIDSVRFHGGIPIAKRYAAMDRGFRRGGTPLLLGTIGCTQAGMDLPQATRVVFYDRDWQYKTEAQSLRRALRPQTMHAVTAEYIHQLGSIDVYQAQMVDFKRDVFRAGLDWAAPEFDDAEFVHFETIIGEFLSELATLRGQNHWDLREQLKRLAA